MFQNLPWLSEDADHSPSAREVVGVHARRPAQHHVRMRR